MRRATSVILALAAASLLGGCAPDPRDVLHQQIAKLREERVEPKAVESERASNAEAERALGTAREGLAAAEEELADAQAEHDVLQAQLAAEQARAAAIAQENGRVLAEIASAGQRVTELDGRIAKARTRATFLRDHAASLARELRAGDPAWANERRLSTLTQLLARAAREYPDDPVVAALARRVEPDAALAVDEAARMAGRLRDRFTSVYALDAAAVASGPPETSAQ